MRASKLQLKHYFLDELSFKVKKNRKPVPMIKLEPGQLHIEVGFGDRESKAGERICELSISLDPHAKRSLPFDLRVSMLGWFAVDSEDDFSESLFQTNAPSVLFSAARELIMTVTGRSILWSIMLPTVIFAPPKPIVKKRKVVRKRV
jgi:preprotein translocase subunit SecB